MQGETLTIDDLSNFDERIVQYLNHLSAMDEAEWNAADIRWRVRNAAGRVVALAPPGGGTTGSVADAAASDTVPFTQRDEYISACLALRLGEFDESIAQIKIGLSEVVPAKHGLGLMGWRELEQRVCGEPRIDIDLLKSITKYDGEYRRQGPAHPVIAMFWRVMEGFSEAERAAVVGFAWGRSRLPPAASVTAIAFNIDASHGGDDFIPTSSTCDFRLHLPQYTSDEALKTKLLYACSVPSQRPAVEAQRSIEYGCGACDEEVVQPSSFGSGDSGGGGAVESLGSSETAAAAAASAHYIPLWVRVKPSTATSSSGSGGGDGSSGGGAAGASSATTRIGPVGEGVVEGGGDDAFNAFFVPSRAERREAHREMVQYVQQTIRADFPAPPEGKKTPFLRTFILKMIISPRQARDKYSTRESTQKERRVFLQAGQSGHLSLSVTSRVFVR